MPSPCSPVKHRKEDVNLFSFPTVERSFYETACQPHSNIENNKIKKKNQDGSNILKEAIESWKTFKQKHNV
jgi:hypothetical protein